MVADCISTINTICKHVLDNDVFYLDAEPVLGTGETIASVSSLTAVDSALTVSSGTVLSAGYTETRVVKANDGTETTITRTIDANKGISMRVSGGTSGAGCSVIRAVLVKSTGNTTAIDCMIEVHGYGD